MAGYYEDAPDLNVEAQPGAPGELTVGDPADEQIRYGMERMGQALLYEEGSPERHALFAEARQPIANICATFRDTMKRQRTPESYRAAAQAFMVLADLHVLSRETFGVVPRPEPGQAIADHVLLAFDYYSQAFEAAKKVDNIARMQACVHAECGLFSVGKNQWTIGWQARAARVRVWTMFRDSSHLSEVAAIHRTGTDTSGYLNEPISAKRQEVRERLARAYTSFATENR